MNLLVALAIFTVTVPLPLILQLVIATVLPVIVGVVTTTVTSSTVKSLTLLALSVVTSGLNELLASVNAGTAFDLGTWFIAAVGTFLAGAASYLGFWKPTGVADKAQAVGVKPKHAADE